MLTNNTCIISLKETITFNSFGYVNVTYIRKSRGLRIDPCITPLETNAGSKNLFPKLTKKFI